MQAVLHAHDAREQLNRDITNEFPSQLLPQKLSAGVVLRTIKIEGAYLPKSTLRNAPGCAHGVGIVGCLKDLKKLGQMLIAFFAK